MYNVYAHANVVNILIEGIEYYFVELDVVVVVGAQQATKIFPACTFTSAQALDSVLGEASAAPWGIKFLTSRGHGQERSRDEEGSC